MQAFLRATAVVLGLLSAAYALAGEDAVGTSVIERLRATLAVRYPNVAIESIAPSPVNGMYEVIAGDRILYSDAAGDHLFAGHLFETASGRNLTAERWIAHTAINFDTLPLERAIVTVRGNGRRHIAVFTDPDCPFSRRLEAELAAMSDITVYNFLYPLAPLHPDAPRKARAIWCSADRSAAWNAWMAREELQGDTTACADDPVGELALLGQRLRVNTTPTIFLANGARIAGFATVMQLEALLADTTMNDLAKPERRAQITP